MHPGRPLYPFPGKRSAAVAPISKEWLPETRMNRIAPTLEQPGPIEETENFVLAQNKKKEKRQWGTGSVLHEKLGLAIRWSEYVTGKDGQRRRKMRYEFVGKVS